MPRDSGGTYSAPASSVAPAVANTDISPTDFNALVSDIGTEITGSVPRNGSAAMSGPLKMGGQQIQLGLGGIVVDETGFTTVRANDNGFRVRSEDGTTTYTSVNATQWSTYSATVTATLMSLSGALTVTGSTTLGTLSAGTTGLGATTLASATVTGNASVGGTFTGTGAATFNSLATFNAGLTVATGTLNGQAASFTSLSTSGAITSGGTLTASGNANVSGALTVTGAISQGGNANVHAGNLTSYIGLQLSSTVADSGAPSGADYEVGSSWIVIGFKATGAGALQNVRFRQLKILLNGVGYAASYGLL